MVTICDARFRATHLIRRSALMDQTETEAKRMAPQMSPSSPAILPSETKRQLANLHH